MALPLLAKVLQPSRHAYHASMVLLLFTHPSAFADLLHTHGYILSTEKGDQFNYQGEVQRWRLLFPGFRRSVRVRAISRVEHREETEKVSKAVK
jgi:hypothetical protein